MKSGAQSDFPIHPESKFFIPSSNISLFQSMVFRKSVISRLFSLVVFINFNFSVFLRLGWVFWNFGGASANTKINAAKPQAPPRQRGRAQPISDAHFREWVTVTRPQEQRYYEQQKSRWTWNAAKTRATTPTHYYEKTQFLTWKL